MLMLMAGLRDVDVRQLVTLQAVAEEGSFGRAAALLGRRQVAQILDLDRSIKNLEKEGVEWAKQILQHSPMAIRVLKSAFNAELDGQAGIQELAGNATLLYYMSEEAQEGKKAYLEKRKPDFKKFPKLP